MQTRGDEVHAEVEEARAGSTPNIVRWVLAISLLAAIVLLTVNWVTGAATSDQDTHTVDAQIRAAERGGQTDSIVGNEADRTDAAKPGESQESANTPNKDAGQ
jgi:hypothetical protein